MSQGEIKTSIAKHPATARITKPVEMTKRSTIIKDFRYNEYDKIKSRYIIAASRNRVFIRYDPKRAKIISINANRNACDFFNSPEAIGLLHFVGCFLSFSMSKMSLIMYSLPESMQKKIKAIITSRHIEKFRMFSEKAIPANIRMFLYHCSGRIVFIRDLIIVLCLSTLI